MAGIVVVFDFDETIIDCDSDNWFVDELGDRELINQLLPTMPWKTSMDRMMEELHKKGMKIEEIAEFLKQAPLHPQIISAIKSAHALGCDLRILSDANLFFIETILKHHGLMDCFSEINTNPTFVDEEGKLRILPFHDFKSSPHGCDLCPPNLCKGLVIERIRASSVFAEGKKRFIYLGDGKGDYCPSLKLSDKDYMMPRKDYAVWDLICKNPLLIKAEVHEWSNGDDLEPILLRLVNTIIHEGDESNNRNNSALISTDCKLQTVPMSTTTNESFPQALPIRH